MHSEAAASENSAGTFRCGKRNDFASFCAFAVALLMLAAMLWTSFEKNLVGTLTQQGWLRQAYGMTAAITHLKFGVGGGAVDLRILAALFRAGVYDDPPPEWAVPSSHSLTDTKLLQSALSKALALDVPPPLGYPTINGEFRDLVGFYGEDVGLATYDYLAFKLFGVNIPGLTYLYFLILTLSLVLYGIGHRRSVGAMVAAAVMAIALYLVACANFVNFAGPADGYTVSGIDLKDPRFLSTIAAFPVLHVIVLWTRPAYRLRYLDYVALALQSALFAFALQLRSSTIWAVLALLLFWTLIGAIALRRNRSWRPLLDWRASRSAFAPVIVLAVLLSGQLVAALSLHPVYRAQGDIPRHTFWQGILSSLQLNQEWDRKYGPSVNGAGGDAMPAVTARIAIMKLPPEQRPLYLNRDGAIKRTALEHFSRIAFFRILRRDPEFVLHAFFIDKPARALRSEREFFGWLFAGLPVWNILVPAAAVMFLVFLVTWDAQAFAALLPTLRILPLFVVMAWLPNWLIILNPMVMIDNFVWLSAFLLMALVASAATLIRFAGFSGVRRPALTA